MGKRSHEERREKKKSKQHQHDILASTSTKDLNTTEDTVSTNNDEILLEMNDETDCVEVEIADEQQQQEVSSLQPMVTATPTQSPSIASTSKAAIAVTSSSKKSTPKQTTTSETLQTPTNIANAKKSNKKRRDSGTSSDEERWLTAIESGKLADVDDELKKMKDPKLMTSRQRAMYERSLNKDGDELPGAELHMSLPIGYSEKPQTAEDVQKRALKILRRKQMADEKREKDKKKTIDRLLNKKENNKQRGATRNKATTKVTVPMISYRNTPTGAFIQLPVGEEFPLKKQIAQEPPPKKLCGITGCTNPKVYNCSKTNIPLCSLACYKKNVQAVRQIMC